MRLDKAVLAGLMCSALASCDVWQSRQPEDDQQADVPFELEIVETRACPLPEGVDEDEKRILGVLVRVTGRHQAGVPNNYFYGSLLTDDGNRYLAELAGCEPVLTGPPLRPEESREGFLNFPLPISKKPRHVVYAPLVGDLDEATRTKQQELP